VAMCHSVMIDVEQTCTDGAMFAVLLLLFAYCCCQPCPLWV